MRTNPYVVRVVPGLRRSTRRSVAFLISSENPDLDAAAVFGRLKDKRLRELRTRFDLWIDGGRHAKYFHGWPNDPQYKHCFVFKWNDGLACHRMYGFLFHPQAGNPAFQVCVLATHAIKTTWETPPGELEGANKLRNDPLVIAAVRTAFPDAKEGRKQWVN